MYYYYFNIILSNLALIVKLKKDKYVFIISKYLMITKQNEIHFVAKNLSKEK